MNAVCVHTHAAPLGADTLVRNFASLFKLKLLCIGMHTNPSGGTNRLTEKPSLVTSNPQLLLLLLSLPMPLPYCLIHFLLLYIFYIPAFFTLLCL